MPRSRERGSNSRPELYKSPALPTELSRQDLYSRARAPRIGITSDITRTAATTQPAVARQTRACPPRARRGSVRILWLRSEACPPSTETARDRPERLAAISLLRRRAAERRDGIR